ncbi:hybrid sensor histidine kinase/response regulator [Ahniella affigens]|uniref:Sensory/regulatory protein RpfC n=1 Tax=Ahniella affigens TaxID=2021234 RepID=A0A2P1PM40_9GAMM|nr:ATP-binding protein [Ahniella affigens]AVP95899.1 hybrid sensor histidine kinase/response regulator [Ahniella affigens]
MLRWIVLVVGLAGLVLASGQVLAEPAMLKWLGLGLAGAALLALPFLGRRNDHEEAADSANAAAPSLLNRLPETNPIQAKEIAELRSEVERLRSIERDLTSAKQSAEAAMMAKGEFLATMSHEIRTPLNAILPLLDLVLSTKLAPDQREYLTTALQSAKQLLSIVDDILDYSKIEANKLDLETTGLNIKEVVDGVTRLMSRNAEGKGLQYTVQIDQNVRLALRGDPTRLRQVLTNLVSNAIKFTERGAVSVHVSRRNDTRTHQEILFAVRDSGIGITNEAQQRLFKEFSQADNSTTRTFGGTGLGLAICKRIVDLMGGQIGVKSEVGKGSVFWFTVPLLKAAGDITPGRTDIAGCRTLLMTGDINLGKRLTGLLQTFDVPVTVSNTAADALNKLKATAKNQNFAYEYLLIDFGSMRATALSLLRGVLRETDLSEVRLIGLSGDDQLPEDFKSGPRSVSLHRNAPDIDYRNALRALLNQEGHQAATGNEAGAEAMAAASNLLADTPAPSDVPTRPAPAPVAAAAFTAPPQSTPSASAGGSETGVGGHVLLVEDNPVNRQVAQRLLTLIGVSFEVAENGKIAVEKAVAGRFDCVLMDCQMPVMDGYTSTRTMRKLEIEGQVQKRPIVAMTANAMVGDREKCLAAGMDDYMSKPLNRNLIEQMLRKWLPPGAQSRVMESQPAAQSAARASAPSRSAAPQSTPANESAIDNRLVSDLMEIMGAEFAELVRVYLEDTPKALSQLERAAQTNDVESLIAPAHSLKSTSANLGALRLSEMAKRLEHGARMGELGEPSLLVAQIYNEYQRAAQQLRQLIGA